MDIIDKYCNASGQLVNHEIPSVIVGKKKKISGPVRHAIKNLFNVQTETMNEKYIGLPSDMERPNNGVFSYLKDRVWKRL